MSLFSCGSTDQSPLTQSLVQKSKRQVPSTMVHHLSLQAAHSYSPLVAQGLAQLCAESLLLDLNPALSSLCISFGGT